MAQILGLDIDKDAVYATLLKVAFRKAELQRYVRIPLTQDPASPGHAPELERAIQDLMRTLGSTPDVIVTALPGEHISLKLLTLPVAAAKRIDEILPFELESLLPFEQEDAVVDHQIISQVAGQMRLLAAAAPRERVAAEIERLRAAGIEPREIAAGATALEGATQLVPELAGPGTTCLVDLGSQRTDVCMLSEGRLELARTLSAGLDDLPEQADMLWRGIQRTIAAHRAAGGDAPGRIYLGGSGATASGAREWLQNRLQTEVVVVTLPQAAGLDSGYAAGFLRATALAGRHAGGPKRIDMRVGEFAHRHAARNLAQYTNLAVGCVVAVLLSSMFAIKADQALLLDEQTGLEARLGGASEEIFGKRVTDPTMLAALIKSQRSNDPLPRYDAFDALATISDAVSPSITHEVRRMRIDVEGDKHEGRFELQGSLGTIEQRDALVAALEHHECIHDIERGKTTPARGQEQINYQIEATIRCPGEAPATPKKSRGR